MCEAFLCIQPHFGLWLKTLNVKLKVVSGQQAECGGAMVGKMPNVTWLDGSFAEKSEVVVVGVVLHHRATRLQMGGGPRIQIWLPHVAHLLAREGPVLG